MSGSLRGLNPPMIGAPSTIIVDGIVERESGTTPPPPGVTLRTVAVVIGIMFVLGMLVLVGFGSKPLPAGSHTGLWLEIGPRFEFTSEPDEYGEAQTWYAEPGPNTVYSVDGTEVSASEFSEAFPPDGALKVSVTASTEGTIERVNAATTYRRTE